MRIEIHKDELLPGFQAQRHHAHGGAIEELDTVNIRRADEAAIERIGPAVIPAAQDIFAAAALRDGSGAMPADIAEGAQRILLIADDYDGLAGDLSGEKGFRIGDGALSAVEVAAGLA